MGFTKEDKKVKKSHLLRKNAQAHEEWVKRKKESNRLKKELKIDSESDNSISY